MIWKYSTEGTDLKPPVEFHFGLFSLDWSEWFSVTPVRAGIPEVKSQQVIHLATRSSRWSLANDNNYCILFSLIIAWPLLMLCWSFHFKPCFAGGVEFAVKNSLHDESGHKRSQCKNHFWHQFKDKLQWLLMRNWLFHPEYSPSKSKHRRCLLRGKRGIWWIGVTIYLQLLRKLQRALHFHIVRNVQ